MNLLSWSNFSYRSLGSIKREPNWLYGWKEEKKQEAKPNWKWTLVYAGKKSKSFKLHCCLSSLHMLILPPGEIIGRVWFAKPWIAQVYAIQLFFLPPVMPQASPWDTAGHRSPPAGSRLSGMRHRCPATPATSRWPSTSGTLPAAQPDLWVQRLALLSVLFSFSAYPLLQGSKCAREYSGKSSSTFWGKGCGSASQPAYWEVPRQQGRDTFYCLCHQWFTVPIM